MATRFNSLPVVGIFCSEKDPLFEGLFTTSAHLAGDSRLCVVTICPLSSDAQEIIRCADANRWDIAVLIVNNIKYSNSLWHKITHTDSYAEFLSYFCQRYQKPVIACYGWPNSDDFGKSLVKAGAAAVFRIPFLPSEFVDSIRSCLRSA